MANDFGCRHSDKLQSFFDIEARGIDYINDNAVSFEFKESWARDKKQMFFSIPKQQLISTDFIVFCVRDEAFYIHRSKSFLSNYGFNNPKERCCLRHNTIAQNSFFETENIKDLKKFIDRLHGSDFI